MECVEISPPLGTGTPYTEVGHITSTCRRYGLSRKRNFPSTSWVLIAWNNNSINTCRLIGEKETHFEFLHMEVFIEMGPMKRPEQATFILFGRRNNEIGEIGRTKNLSIWVLNEESK